MEGLPIRVRFAPALSAHRGRLLSGQERGTSVHAGTFLRKREIVLDSDLLGRPGELTRIVAHEIFHFVWLRSGNTIRRSFEELLGEEMRQGARGELGWSAEMRKQALSTRDRRDRTRRWREYSCESFCDSAAWLFAGAARHDEFTLAERFRRGRREWFRHAGLAGSILV